MAISNILKSLDLPIIGKSTYRTEDEFLAPKATPVPMPLGSGTSQIPQQIIIACKGKRRRVIGYLSEGVKLNGTVQWDPIVQTAGISALDKGMSVVSTLGQLGFGGNTNGGGSSMGTSIQQPWLDRKFWKHSNPFDLNFTFNLVSETSSRDEVFLPAQALLSFCYPREVNNVQMVEKAKTSIGGFVSNEPNTAGNTNLAKAALDTLGKTFAIPGPSLKYTNDQTSDNGDAVTIVIGNMFAFGACYLKSVSIEFSPNIDYSGYPTWCKCSVSAEAMDSNYCTSDGDFNISQWANSANNVSDLVGALTQTVTDAAKNVANIAKATANAIGAFGQIFQ